MDHDRFDALTRSLGVHASRRSLGRALAGGGLGALLGSAFGALAVDAKQKRHKKKNKKKKPKKPTFNAFGCLDIGQPCRGNSANCCSGICQGKKPKKGKKDKSTCVAHNAGICAADLDACTVGTPVLCNSSNPDCVCTLTTGNAGFCGSFPGNDTGGIRNCRVCSKDTDCQAEFGAGAACVVLGGPCTPLCAATGRTACAPPCA